MARRPNQPTSHMYYPHQRGLVLPRWTRASDAPHSCNPLVQKRRRRANPRSLPDAASLLSPNDRAWCYSDRDPLLLAARVRVSPTFWNQSARFPECAGLARQWPRCPQPSQLRSAVNAAVGVLGRLPAPNRHSTTVQEQRSSALSIRSPILGSAAARFKYFPAGSLLV